MKRNENKKSLKKKVLVVSGLALLLGLIGYTGGNTYAKYISSDTTESQTATVAKWGVVVTASVGQNEAFSKNYKADSATDDTDNLEVASSGTNMVVAPGTQGSFTVTVSGKPEVAAKLSFKVDNTYTDVYYDADSTDDENEVYYPVVWTFSNSSSQLVSGSLKDVVTFINAYTLNYEPNDDSLAETYTVTWNWAFEQGHDDYDTILGDIAAGKAAPANSANSIEINFSLVTTVVQLDTAA